MRQGTPERKKQVILEALEGRPPMTNRELSGFTRYSYRSVAAATHALDIEGRILGRVPHSWKGYLAAVYWELKPSQEGRVL